MFMIFYFVSETVPFFVLPSNIENEAHLKTKHPVKTIVDHCMLYPYGHGRFVPILAPGFVIGDFEHSRFDAVVVIWYTEIIKTRCQAWMPQYKRNKT